MTGAPQPRMHGLTHVQGGPDPVPCCLDAGAATTYLESVLAHPCIAHYWPCDETTGDLLDRVGGSDLVPTLDSTAYGTYPQYGATGPFTEQPEYTAVENQGDGGVGAADDNRFVASIDETLFEGSPAWTVETWAYMSDEANLPPSLLTIGPAPSSDLIALYLFGSTPRELHGTHNGEELADPDAFPEDSWQYIVFRSDGSDIELLRNGDLVDTGTAGSISWASTPLVTLMNFNVASDWRPWRGRAAHVAIYNCAIDDTTIAEHIDLSLLGPNTPAGYVPTSDGAGGFDWAAPTIEVDY